MNIGVVEPKAVGGALLSAMDFMNSLTVTPEEMVSRAQNVNEKIKNLQNAFDSMKRSVNKTQNYWIGIAGDAHRDNYRNKEDDVVKSINRLKEEVKDLHDMAAVYARTETSVTEAAQDLPFDVIV